MPADSLVDRSATSAADQVTSPETVKAERSVVDSEVDSPVDHLLPDPALPSTRTARPSSASELAKVARHNHTMHSLTTADATARTTWPVTAFCPETRRPSTPARSATSARRLATSLGEWSSDFFGLLRVELRVSGAGCCASSVECRLLSAGSWVPAVIRCRSLEALLTLLPPAFTLQLKSSASILHMSR